VQHDTVGEGESRMQLCQLLSIGIELPLPSHFLLLTLCRSLLCGGELFFDFSFWSSLLNLIGRGCRLLWDVVEIAEHGLKHNARQRPRHVDRVDVSSLLALLGSVECRHDVDILAGRSGPADTTLVVARDT
jgi:hypothetical protein